MRGPMTQVATEAGGDVEPAVLAGRPHSVQFYETDAFLGDAVAEFLAQGFRADEPAVVIASEPHRRMFVERLDALGIDVDRLLASGRLVLFDAHDTLASFMSPSGPVADKFVGVVSPVIERLC